MVFFGFVLRHPWGKECFGLESRMSKWCLGYYSIGFIWIDTIMHKLLLWQTRDVHTCCFLCDWHTCKDFIHFLYEEGELLAFWLVVGTLVWLPTSAQTGICNLSFVTMCCLLITKMWRGVLLAWELWNVFFQTRVRNLSFLITSLFHDPSHVCWYSTWLH